MRQILHSWLAIGTATLVLAMTVACGGVKSSADLVGSYTASGDGWSSSLVLRADGQYEQKVVVKRHEVPLLNSGRWTFNSDKNDLEMEAALTVTQPGGALLPEDQWTHGWWLLHPERTWSGAVRLPLNPDTDAAFTKLNPDATGGS
jgi:hypothetical protein